jgi:hypothetical protein
MLLDAMGDLLARSYLMVRRSESEAYGANDVLFELEHHFFKY